MNSRWGRRPQAPPKSALCCALVALASGCSEPPRAVVDGSANVPASAGRAASAASPPTPTASAAAAGPLDPEVFASPRAAFEAAIASKPLVVGVGEAHTQKEAAGRTTTAKRFTDAILPALEGRASDLLVELMMPPTGCHKKTEAARTAQAPVTEKQAESNQGDYVKMGEAARKIGVVPDLLRPTCDDLAAVAAAGEDAVPRSLEMIKRLTVAQTKKALENPRHKPEAMVVVYGGALHNDRETTPERRAWAYATDVAALVKDRYVEVDVFSADAVGDGGPFAKLPWYPRYDKAKFSNKTVLFRLRKDAFVIVLPAPT